MVLVAVVHAAKAVVPVVVDLVVTGVVIVVLMRVRAVVPAVAATGGVTVRLKSILKNLSPTACI